MEAARLRRNEVERDGRGPEVSRREDRRIRGERREEGRPVVSLGRNDLRARSAFRFSRPFAAKESRRLLVLQ